MFNKYTTTFTINNMKNKILLSLIIIIIFSSCVAKKTTTEFKEVIKRDSIYIIKDRFITKQVTDTLTIERPCDSVTGKLKDFEKEIRTTNAKVVLRSVKGAVRVYVDIDSTVNSRIKEFKLNHNTEKEIKEVEKVIFRTPLWVWLVMLIEGLIIFLLIKF